MGIDVHTLKLIMFASKGRPLGRTATIGRMGLHVPKEKLGQLNFGTDYGPYCEDFLKAEFGAINVDSFDKSEYEQATHIADLNEPLTIEPSYDTIIDGGTLEHIFNVPQALESVSKMCALGGQILHVLPANNLCGHGFWQFSPDLFLSLYSNANGYDETQVFLADVSNEQEWYEVRKPQNGERVEVVSSSSVFVLVKTKRTGTFSHKDVQQSDYRYVWDGNENIPSGRPSNHRLAERIRRAAKRSIFLPSARLAEREWQRLLRPARSLSPANPHLVKHKIDALLAQ
jgi:hypothetical protein